VFRRKRTGTGPDGKPRTGFFPGWYVRLRKDGREYIRKGGSDRGTALEVLQKLIREQERLDLLDEQPRGEIRFEVFAEEYLEHARRAFTTATYESRRTMINNLLIPDFKCLYLDRITPARIEHFLAKRRRTVSGATCNRNLGILSSIFQRAIKLGYLRENPAERMDRDREGQKPLPLVPKDEQDRLIEFLPEEHRLLSLLALDTGMRLGEIMRLEWADLDLQTGRVRIRITKNKRPRMVHMTGRVLERLLALRTQRVVPISGPDLVFPDAIGGRWLKWSWRKAFKAAVRKIGRPELRFHDLRHLCAINLVRRGMDLPSVQAVLGHTSLISTLRYAEFQDDTAAARAAALLDAMHS
jgi:integrase